MSLDIQIYPNSGMIQKRIYTARLTSPNDSVIY